MKKNLSILEIKRILIIVAMLIISVLLINTLYLFKNEEHNVIQYVGKVENKFADKIFYKSSNSVITLNLKGIDNNYLSNNLTTDNIIVKVGGTVVQSTSKILGSAVSTTNGVEFPLNITGVTGNGELTIEVTENTLYDKAENKNILNTIKPGIMIDNIAPEIVFETNGNSTYQESQSTKVTIEDGNSSYTKLKYRWIKGTTQLTQLSDFTTEDGGDFQNENTITKNTGDGIWYLWIYAEDLAGNYTIKNSNAFKLANSVPSVTYYLNNGSWLSSTDGEMAGTTGQALSGYFIKAGISNTEIPGGIIYNTYQQDNRWLTEQSNLSECGKTGLKTEALYFKLIGELADYYDVYYKTHSGGYGWLGWTKNGEYAGTVEQSKGVEAYKVVLVKKGNNPPTEDSTFNAYYEKATVSYSVYVAGKGWVTANEGAIAGTTGQALSTTALKISVDTKGLNGNINYISHEQSNGWLTWKVGPEQSGNTQMQMEAFAIRLDGALSQFYDVYYKAHSSSKGWLGWAKNGAYAGTEGYGYAIEAIKVVIVSKNMGAPIEDSSLSSFYKNTPAAHTHNFDGRCGTLHSSGSYYWSCTCGGSHNTYYHIVCSGCGAQSGEWTCPNYPLGSVVAGAQ